MYKRRCVCNLYSTHAISLSLPATTNVSGLFCHISLPFILTNYSLFFSSPLGVYTRFFALQSFSNSLFFLFMIVMPFLYENLPEKESGKNNSRIICCFNKCVRCERNNEWHSNVGMPTNTQTNKMVTTTTTIIIIIVVPLQ